MIEPAGAGTTPRRARGSWSCSARRSAGPRRRAASSGTRPTCWCQPSRARPPSAWPCRRASTSRWPPPSTSTALPDGELPLAFNFNGTVHYRGDDGRLQMSLVPWACSAEYRMPVSIWRELIEHYYPRSGWIALHERHAPGAPAREGAPRRCRRSTRAWRSCSRGLVERAGRLAALRGLRALSVHAGRDQERHAHAVRDRLPARVRAAARHDLRPPGPPVRGRGR